MRGRCSCVNTSMTPPTRSAAPVSMRVMRPLAMVDVTMTPWARPGALHSPAYLAAPVTLARPSTRDVGVPICVYIAALPDFLVRLGLRRCLRGLRQRANDRAARKIDLEVVMFEPLRVAQQEIGRAPEGRLVRRLPAQRRFGCRVAPGLVRHAAKREPRVRDPVAVERKPRRDRDEGERIGEAVPDLPVGVIFRKALRG